MSEYSQPEFYRFNEDSLDLVRWVRDKKLEVSSLLDLGAGCGVIACEYHQGSPVERMTLLEVQEDFRPHLVTNVKHPSAEIIIDSFSRFHPDQRFDLILSNPPYFLKGHGQASKDERRNIARSFQRDSWSELLRCVDRSLMPTGRCFMVLRLDSVIEKEIRLGLEEINLKLSVITRETKAAFLELSRLDVERA